MHAGEKASGPGDVGARRILTRFSADDSNVLTIGKTVLQTVNTRFGYPGLRALAQPGCSEREVEVDDTPVMESFAEGYQHAQR
jgi:hypothetical protein